MTVAAAVLMAAEHMAADSARRMFEAQQASAAESKVDSARHALTVPRKRAAAQWAQAQQRVGQWQPAVALQGLALEQRPERV